jgi:hypothetical protein
MCETFAKLSRKITIKRIKKSTEDGKSWNVDPVMLILLSLGKGGIRELLLHPKADQLFVYTTTKLCVISIPATETKESAIVDPMSGLKWICHAFSDEHFLGLGPDSLHFLGWSSLEETNLLTFCISESNSAKKELLSGCTVSIYWEQEKLLETQS